MEYEEYEEKMLLTRCLISFGRLEEARQLFLSFQLDRDLPPEGVKAYEDWFFEVRKSVTHTLTLKKVQDWVNSGARTPKEAVMKAHLRGLL